MCINISTFSVNFRYISCKLLKLDASDQYNLELCIQKVFLAFDSNIYIVFLLQMEQVYNHLVDIVL